MSDKFCELCPCTGRGALKENNWACPLLGRNICGTCCQVEVDGGMGAQDTFKELCKLSERTPQEAHAACVACEHGGKVLDMPPEVIYVRPGTEEENDEFIEDWKTRLDWLNGNRKGKEPNDLPGNGDSH